MRIKCSEYIFVGELFFSTSFERINFSRTRASTVSFYELIILRGIHIVQHLEYIWKILFFLILLNLKLFWCLFLLHRSLGMRISFCCCRHNDLKGNCVNIVAKRKRERKKEYNNKENRSRGDDMKRRIISRL